MTARLMQCAVVLLGMLALAAAAPARAALPVVPGCGSLDNAFGPYDYRVDKKELNLVEKHHFSPDIEFLRDRTPGTSLDYTLRAIPNHPRALFSMMKLGLRDKKERVNGANYSIECYMLRAEAFQPRDATVKVVFGLYLLETGRHDLAIKKLESAKALDSRDPNIPYNIGLAYFQMGDYDRALQNAHEAYRLGFPLPGLRNLLERKGRWKDDAQAQAQADGSKP